jgi:hypothetical protein
MSIWTIHNFIPTPRYPHTRSINIVMSSSVSDTRHQIATIADLCQDQSAYDWNVKQAVSALQSVLGRLVYDESLRSNDGLAKEYKQCMTELEKIDYEHASSVVNAVESVSSMVDKLASKSSAVNHLIHLLSSGSTLDLSLVRKDLSDNDKAVQDHLQNGTLVPARAELLMRLKPKIGMLLDEYNSMTPDQHKEYAHELVKALTGLSGLDYAGCEQWRKPVAKGQHRDLYDDVCELYTNMRLLRFLVTTNQGDELLSPIVSKIKNGVVLILRAKYQSDTGLDNIHCCLQSYVDGGSKRPDLLLTACTAFDTWASVSHNIDLNKLTADYNACVKGTEDLDKVIATLKLPKA